MFGSLCRKASVPSEVPDFEGGERHLLAGPCASGMYLLLGSKALHCQSLLSVEYACASCVTEGVGLPSW